MNRRARGVCGGGDREFLEYRFDGITEDLCKRDFSGEYSNSPSELLRRKILRIVQGALSDT